MSKDENKLMVMLKSDNVKERFIETVGPSGGRWITSIINAANLNPQIWECEPISVVTAGLNAATLRLSLDPSTGQAAILPFNTKQGKKATFVPMVRGLKQLALRTGQYRYINSTQVYKDAEIEEDPMSGIIYLKTNPKSKDIKGYYAAFELMNGYQATIYMTVEEIEAHAKRYSPSYNKRKSEWYRGSMWVEDFPAMAKKTVLRLLLLRDGLLDPGVRDILDNLETPADAELDFEVPEDDAIIEGEVKEIDPDEINKSMGF